MGRFPFKLEGNYNIKASLGSMRAAPFFFFNMLNQEVGGSYLLAIYLGIVNPTQNFLGTGYLCARSKRNAST